jgi:DnaJ homolog subfamily C member 3
MGKDKSNALGDGLLQRYEEAMDSNTSPTHLSPQTPFARPRSIPLPLASKRSPRRQEIMRSLCRAYMRLNQARTGEKWCDMLLGMEGSHEDVDGLVGKGEAALKREDWDEAVRLMSKAFEASGKSSRDVNGLRWVTILAFQADYFSPFMFRYTNAYRKHRNCLNSRNRRIIIKSSTLLVMRMNGLSRRLSMSLNVSECFFSDVLPSRNAAKKAHPDKGGSEAKMAAVNEAYEVLSNPGYSFLLCPLSVQCLTFST